MNYRIKVKDGDDNFLGEFDTFRKLKFGKKLNYYGSASFEVPVQDPKAESLIALRIYSVWIYRVDEEGNETLKWSGEQALRQGKLDDKGGNWVTIYCYTWLEQFYGRYTSAFRLFTQVDAGEIAWTLIDETQADSDFGITEGTIETTMPRDREYKNQNIGEALVNLTNVINGFDLEINDSKVLNIYASQGVDRSDLIFEYGYNIKEMTISEDFTHPANRAIILGTSGDPSGSLRVERDDASSQTQYKLREALSNEMTTSDTETLEEKGDAVLRKFGLPLLKTSMDLVRSSYPTIDDFALGDIITLKVINGIYNIEEQFRIYEWDITFNEDNTEKLDLVLGNFIIPNFS